MKGHTILVAGNGEHTVLLNGRVSGVERDCQVSRRDDRIIHHREELYPSVFVKKPERIVALGFIMVLCLLVYRLAEGRVRQRLAATDQTVPDQLRRPTSRPTLRWLFQCFEGIDLLHITQPQGTHMVQTLRLEKVHRLVLQLLGPAYENSYLAFQENAE